MNCPTKHDTDGAIASHLIDPAQVESVLSAALPDGLVDGFSPQHLRIERCWPGRDGSTSFEWSFELAPGTRYTLYGTAHASDCAPANQAGASRPAIRHGRLCDVLFDIPLWRLTVHSPDRDPGLTHLGPCLDGPRMARRIAALQPHTDVNLDLPPDDVVCQPLAYRAGRRAALLYQGVTPELTTPWVVGKVFHNGRGQGLVDVHQRINHQLAERSGGRVRTAVAVGYLPDEHMAVFSWAPGRSLGEPCKRSTETIDHAVDALAHLHRTWLPELPQFTARDECQIMTRWHSFMQRIKPDQARHTARLVDDLLEWGRRVESAHRCTIHRDYYAAQVVTTRRTVTVLDLDTLALGDPAIDLGNFIAHGYLDLISENAAPLDFGDLTDRVVQRYDAASNVIDDQALAFYCASALFRIGAVHSGRTSTGRCAKPLWAQARELIGLSGQRGKR